MESQNRDLARELVALANSQGGRRRAHRKIVRGMKEHNGTEPALIEEGERFRVRLWKERRA